MYSFQFFVCCCGTFVGEYHGNRDFDNEWNCPMLAIFWPLNFQPSGFIFAKAENKAWKIPAEGVEPALSKKLIQDKCKKIKLKNNFA
jgi:hypothetical protein